MDFLFKIKNQFGADAMFIQSLSDQYHRANMQKQITFHVNTLMHRKTFKDTLTPTYGKLLLSLEY